MKDIISFVCEKFANLQRGDEFYTRYKDIEKELSKYEGKIMSVKIERLNNLYLAELSKIIFKEIKNPIIKTVNLTAVEITNDLSFAKVYFTCMNEDKDKVLEELNSAKGFLRTKLAEVIEIRHTPELVFNYDNSIEYGMNIERIIKNIHEKDKDNK